MKNKKLVKVFYRGMSFKGRVNRLRNKQKKKKANSCAYAKEN